MHSRRVIRAEFRSPSGFARRRIRREMGAGSGGKKRLGDVPFLKDAGHSVQGKSLADPPEVDFEVGAGGTDCVCVGFDDERVPTLTPLRSIGGVKRPARQLPNRLRTRQTGEGLRRHPSHLPFRQTVQSSDVAPLAKPAEQRLHPLKLLKCRIRRLLGITRFFAGDVDSKSGRHRLADEFVRVGEGVGHIPSHLQPPVNISHRPRLALFPCQHRIRFGVILELFLLRIPLKLPAEEHRDIPDVADGNRAVARFGGGVAGGAGLDAVDEVAVFAPFAFAAADDDPGAVEVGFIGTDFGIEDFGVARLQGSPPAVEADPAFRSLEADARIAVDDLHGHAVCVLVVDLEGVGRVENIVLRRELALAGDLDRTGLFRVVPPTGPGRSGGRPSR